MSCPCKECLTKSICKSKKYSLLTSECPVLLSWLSKEYKEDNDVITHRLKVVLLYVILRPTNWVIGNIFDGGFIIRGDDLPERLSEVENKVVRRFINLLITKGGTFSDEK
jgi:hypothetical protein